MPTAKRLIAVTTTAFMGVLLLGAIVFSWGNRTGRYQIVQSMSPHEFVVLDTATGLLWVYERQSKREGFKIIQSERPVRFSARILPPAD